MITRNLLVVCLLVTCLPVVTFGAGPTLTLSETEFDFGFAPQHAKISHTFTISAAPDDSLIINDVVPGCGCTKAPLEKSQLGPGESTNLEIIFSTKAYSGKIRKSPRIKVKDAAEPTRVTILSNVVKRPDSTTPIVIKPYKLDISQFGEKVRDSMVFSITNVSDQAVSPALVSCPSSVFTVELPATIKPGESAEAFLKLRDNAVSESFEKSFTLELSDSASTRFTVPVKRVVKSPTTRADVNWLRNTAEESVP